jgi:hypothetical protein
MSPKCCSTQPLTCATSRSPTTAAPRCRGVVALEEALGVLERRALQVDEVAVAVVAVGEVVEQHRRHDEPGEAAVRPVDDVDADLVLHDGDLVVEVLLRHRDAAHPVGLEEQRELGRRARHDLVVVRVVDVRRAVERAAVALHVVKCSVLPRLADPWNIRCSNRCAKPVRPCGSLRMPTS